MNDIHQYGTIIAKYIEEVNIAGERVMKRSRTLVALAVIALGISLTSSLYAGCGGCGSGGSKKAEIKQDGCGAGCKSACSAKKEKKACCAAEKKECTAEKKQCASESKKACGAKK